MRGEAVMTNIPTELLRTLVAVVDLRSFTKAAQSLGVTQPAVSAQIKRLQSLLGSDLLDPYPEVLRALSDTELAALVASFEPTGGADRSGAIDWSDLHQRMHYIVHLFRVFHEQRDLYDAPFTPAVVEQFLAGVIPDGDL